MNEATSLSPSPKVRVLICDDHELIRQALRMVVNDQPDMEVVGEAADGEEAVIMATTLLPEVVVTDIEMPGMSGIEATKRIKEAVPDAIILALTVHDSSEYILSILEAGASGYLTKGIISQEIPNAIRAAISGESTLSGAILDKLLDYALKYRTKTEVEKGLAGSLNEREIEMLRMAAQGASNKVIAQRLSLSENTVKKYMMAVFVKLGTHSRTAAVIAAEKMGLLQ